MEYKLSKDIFLRESQMFSQNGEYFYHKQGRRFKLFPFKTSVSDYTIVEISPLIGDVLCNIEGKKTSRLDLDQLIDKLQNNVDMDDESKDLFNETIRQLLLDDQGEIHPFNLQMLEQMPYEGENKNLASHIAEYIADVLGDKEVLKRSLQNSNENSQQNSNVFERLILSNLDSTHCDGGKRLSYFRITNSLKKCFEADFAYIIGEQEDSLNHLTQLFEFYYFSYTAQACMQLNRFMDGERENIIPLYFSLDWEKTSMSRQCYTEGWQKLQRSIKNIFAHAVTLEILNQTEDKTKQYDYIAIRNMIDSNKEKDHIISTEIDEVTSCYREAFQGCSEMRKLKKQDTSSGRTADSIKYLFDSINAVLQYTERHRVYDEYAKNFSQYCNKYLKNRGRSGMMLNLTEENLIFLTELCIKDREAMRLNDVFEGLRARGIFLDSISKAQVAEYYEKLNLIEKKSDSGDAKYVKRIL